MSETLCPLLWNHMSTSADGKYRICCLAQQRELEDRQGQVMKVRTHTISEATDSNLSREVRRAMLRGEKHPVCKSCYDIEHLGGTSTRQEKMRTYDWNFEKARSATGANGEIYQFPTFLDIRLGNACNLKCIMCDPFNSNQWYEDWEALHGPYEIEKSDFKWVDPSSKGWIDILDNLESIKHFYFTGGEPTINMRHLQLLELLVEKSLSHDVSIIYHSNLAAKFPKKLLEIWGEFESVAIGCSIDAKGRPLEYMRYPTKWDVVRENFDLLEKHQIDFWLSPTPSVLNGPYLLDLLDWAEEFGISEDRVILKPLVYPNYQSLQIYPETAKKSLSKKYRDWSKKHPQYQHKLEHLVTYMNDEDQSSKAQSFVSKMKILDKTRDLSIEKDLPKVIELLSQS